MFQDFIDELTGRADALDERTNSYNSLNNHINSLREKQLALIEKDFSQNMKAINAFQSDAQAKVAELTTKKNNSIKVLFAIMACMDNDATLLEKILIKTEDTFSCSQVANYYPIQMLLSLYLVDKLDVKASIIKLLKYDVLDYRGFCYKISPIHKMLADPDLKAAVRERLLADVIKAIEQHNFALALSLIEYDIEFFKKATVSKIGNKNLLSYVAKIATEAYDPTPGYAFIKKLIGEYGFEAKLDLPFLESSLNTLSAHPIEPVPSMTLFKQLMIDDYGIRSPFEIHNEASFKKIELFRTINLKMAKLSILPEDIAKFEYSLDGCNLRINHLNITYEIALFINEHIFPNFMSISFYGCNFGSGISLTLQLGLIPCRPRQPAVTELHFIGCQFSERFPIVNAVIVNQKIKKVSYKDNLILGHDPSFPHIKCWPDYDFAQIIYSQLALKAPDEFFRRCKIEFSCCGVVELSSVRQFYERMHAAGALDVIYFENLHVDSSLFENFAKMLANKSKNKLKRLFLRNIELKINAIKAIIQIIKNSPELSEVVIYKCSLDHDQSRPLLSALIEEVKSHGKFKQFDVFESGVADYTYAHPTPPTVMSPRDIPQIEYSADGRSVCIKSLRITNDVGKFISENIFRDCVSVSFYSCQFEGNTSSILPMELMPSTQRVSPANVREISFIGCDFVSNYNVCFFITDNPNLRKVSIKGCTPFPAELLTYIYSNRIKVASDEWFQRCRLEINDVAGTVDQWVLTSFYERMHAAKAFEEICFENIEVDYLVFERFKVILSDKSTNKIKRIILKNMNLDSKALNAILEIIKNSPDSLEVGIYNCNLDVIAKCLLAFFLMGIKTNCRFKAFDVVNCGVGNYSKTLASRRYPPLPESFNSLIPSLNLDYWKKPRLELLKQAVATTPTAKITQRNSSNAFRLFLKQEEYEELKQSLSSMDRDYPTKSLAFDTFYLGIQLTGKGKKLIDTFFRDYVNELKSFDSNRWYGSVTDLHIIARILGCRIHLSDSDGSLKTYGSKDCAKEILVIRNNHMFQGYCTESKMLYPNTSDELNLFRACIHANLKPNRHNNRNALLPLIEEGARRLQKKTFNCVQYSQDLCEAEYKAALLKYLEASDKDANHIALAARELPQAGLAVMEKFISISNMIHALSIVRNIGNVFKVSENKKLDSTLKLLDHVLEAQRSNPECLDYTIDVGNNFNQFETINIKKIRDSLKAILQNIEGSIDEALKKEQEKLKLSAEATQELAASKQAAIKVLEQELEKMYHQGAFDIEKTYQYTREQQDNAMGRMLGTVALSAFGIGMLGGPLQSVLMSSFKMTEVTATMVAGAVINSTAGFVINGGGDPRHLGLNILKGFIASKIAVELTSIAFKGANIYSPTSKNIVEARAVTVFHNAAEAMVHASFNGNNIIKEGALTAVSSAAMNTAFNVDPRTSAHNKTLLDASVAATKTALEGLGLSKIAKAAVLKAVESGCFIIGGTAASVVNAAIRTPIEVTTTTAVPPSNESTPPTSSGSKKPPQATDESSSSPSPKPSSNFNSDTHSTPAPSSSSEPGPVPSPRVPTATPSSAATNNSNARTTSPTSSAPEPVLPPRLPRRAVRDSVGDWYDLQIYRASKRNQSPSYAQRIADVFISPAYGKANELSPYERFLHQEKMRHATSDWLMGNGNLDHLFTGAYQAPSPDMRYYWSHEYASRVLPEFSLKQIFSLSESQRTSRLNQDCSSLVWPSSIPSKKLYSLSESNSQYIARVFRYRYRPDFSDRPAIDNIAFTAGVGAGIAATLANMFAVHDDNFMHTGEFQEYTPNYRDIEAIDNAIYAIRNISTIAKPIFNAYVQHYEDKMSEAAQHRDDGNHFMSGFTSSSANLGVAIDAATVLTAGYGAVKILPTLSRVVAKPVIFLGKQSKHAYLIRNMGTERGRAVFALTEALNSATIVNESAGGLFASGTRKQIIFSQVDRYAQPKLPNNVAAVCRDEKHINIKGVDVIKLGPGTLTGTDKLLLKNGSKIKSIDGYFDMVVHGSPEGFYVRRGDMELFINHRSMANYIKTLDGYKSGMNIRLISCNTGKNSLSVAQDLSNKLGVKVMAPSDFVHIYPNGKMVIGPDQYTFSGKWTDFIPATTGLKPNL